MTSVVLHTRQARASSSWKGFWEICSWTFFWGFLQMRNNAFILLCDSHSSLCCPVFLWVPKCLSRVLVCHGLWHKQSYLWGGCVWLKSCSNGSVASFKLVLSCCNGVFRIPSICVIKIHFLVIVLSITTTIDPNCESCDSPVFQCTLLLLPASPFWAAKLKQHSLVQKVEYLDAR